MVIWLTGRQGAGKTTLAKILHNILDEKLNKVILLDGDKLREVLGNHNYDNDSRSALAMTYARLSNMLSQQGATVICATVSMFHSVREWNRLNNEQYFEVYIKVEPDVLIKRNQKKLYSEAALNNKNYLHGYDIPFEEPLAPDLILNNNGLETPLEAVNKIVMELIK
ncbi:adenylyl-sulfate kinase [Pseudoalteromonas rhizosphaerae]|uniref:Adenylyl-sulfate kinase n=1 Tax=Pseudoalteromonas rhizosphaerae TaxID=2518973 RepID=A0ABW8KUF8_9GAMM